MQQGAETIIEIRGAYKRYTSHNVVLRGLNMTVAKGTIYGLLGPSGCGKTTLLSCIAGYHSLDSGTITVKVNNKKQLGYMPQEIALMELFTVSEMLQYFGRVNGLSSSKVVERGNELLHLMELSPDIYWKRVIGSLSGGQQRRISLTIALVHDPVLLILDEPTVGLDPLISQRLWEYFLEITEQNGKTLIITTHYIEEARHAHMIGLMRNGVLLAEAAPLKLLAEHKCDALEEVFLILSQQQRITSIENDEVYPKIIPSKKPFDDGVLWNRKRMEAQVYKNICYIRRNIPMMVFTLILPALLMALFCVVYSDKLNGVKIAVVTEEVLPDSCQNPANLSVVVPLCKVGSRLSCQYIRLIADKSYIMEEYKDFDSAFQSVVHGRSRAMLHFAKTYSWSLIRRLSEGIITPDRYINSSMVDVYIDRAEMTIGYKIEKDIRDSFYQLVKLVYTNCKYNPRGAENVVRFEKPIYGENSPTFTHTAMPGFIIPVVFYFTTYFSATALGSEKMSGFLERCLIAGVRHTELMFAHAIAQIVMVTGQNVIILTIAYGVYDLPLKGSWILIAIFISLAELQGMFYGFLLATVIDEEKIVTFSAVGTVVCLFLSCGMFWPLEGAQWFIYMMLRQFPIVMAVESYRSITIRAWNLTHMYIIKSIIANVGFALFILIIYILASRLKK